MIGVRISAFTRFSELL